MDIPVTDNAETESLHRLHRRQFRFKATVLLILVASLLASILLSVSIGSVPVHLFDIGGILLHKLLPAVSAVDGQSGALERTVVWDLRLPRILLATIAGLALAGSGTVMQSVLRNPLVSPFTLGLSGAAAFGAALAIILGAAAAGTGRYWIMLSAFGFGMVTVFLIYGIASLKGSGRETYLLSGIAISYLFSAGVSVLKYVSDVEALREIVIWLMGGLWGANWTVLGLLFPVVLAGLAWLMAKSTDLNAMAAGEDVATSLGVNVRRLRLGSLVLATFVSAATIAFTGVIGFIGLMAPHISRMIVGGDNRFLFPCSCLLGAVILVLSDTVGRTIMAPTEIPVGIVTSFVGVPFFLFILIRQRRQWWG